MKRTPGLGRVMSLLHDWVVNSTKLILPHHITSKRSISTPFSTASRTLNLERGVNVRAVCCFSLFVTFSHVRTSLSHTCRHSWPFFPHLSLPFIVFSTLVTRFPTLVSPCAFFHMIVIFVHTTFPCLCHLSTYHVTSLLCHSVWALTYTSPVPERTPPEFPLWILSCIGAPTLYLVFYLIKLWILSCIVQGIALTFPLYQSSCLSPWLVGWQQPFWYG